MNEQYPVIIHLIFKTIKRTEIGTIKQLTISNFPKQQQKTYEYSSTDSARIKSIFPLQQTLALFCLLFQIICQLSLKLTGKHLQICVTDGLSYLLNFMPIYKIQRLI